MIAHGNQEERRRRRTTAPPEIIHRRPHPIRAGGSDYNVTVLAVERTDGTWAGWIEFEPVAGGERLRTAEETSQPNRGAVEYWASGLEEIYLEGAFKRARA